MIAAEPQPDLRGATAVDGAAARAALLDAATAWSAKARLEAFPRDRLWVRAACGACGRALDRVFCYGQSPWTGGDGGPLYRELGDLPAILDDALRGRAAHVDREEWRLALDCGCGAPAHHRRAHGAALLHAVLGSGAGLVVSRIEPDGGATFLRAADGGAALVPFEGTPDGFRAAFGVPFSPLDPWGGARARSARARRDGLRRGGGARRLLARRGERGGALRRDRGPPRARTAHRGSARSEHRRRTGLAVAAARGGALDRGGRGRGDGGRA
ncbi:MAG: hypothetical protein M5U28_08275 [Sandaracinaceae bacterium]|nr:hypothetical protein [Sandaracinaceae bacterium]